MVAAVHYVLSPFKVNKNHGYYQGFKIYFQATKDIYKKDFEIDVSISNAKYIIDHFLGLLKQYFWVRLALMVHTVAGNKNIFWKVENMYLEDTKAQAWIYFGL